MSEKKTALKRILECFFSGAIVALLLLLVLWFINFFKVFELPSFISDFFDGREESPDSSYFDESHFYEFLEQNNHSESDISYISIDTENVKGLIDVLISHSNFYWEVETTLFYDKDTTVTTHKMWDDGESVRVDSVSNGLNNSLIITDSETVFRNNLTGETRTISGDTDFTPENIINIADIKFYIDSEFTDITDARLIETAEEKYLFVKFYTEKFNKTDEFYLSLDYGVVLSATSEINGVVTFSQKTKDFVFNFEETGDLFSLK